MEESQADETKPEAKSAPRRLSRRKKRVVAVAVVIVVIAILIAVWGSQSQRTYSPDDIAASPGSFVGKTVQVRGLIRSVNATNLTFVLEGYNVNLTVHYTSLPNAFEAGKEAIIKGTVQVISGGGWIFVAQDIIVGHPK